MLSFARALLFSSLLGLAQASGEECQLEHDQDDTISWLQMSRGESPAPCPYNFDPPACSDADVQSPRNLSPQAPGRMFPKAATLTRNQSKHLPLTNVHFHLGAEHKSVEYGNGTDSAAWDAKPSGPRPGFMCSSKGAPSSELKPYKFKHCGEHVEVGKSYEIHYVHSSAGYSRKEELSRKQNPAHALRDGLHGAANGHGQLNPMIVVNAQVVLLTNGGEDDFQIKAHDWTPTRRSSVMYPGSTTGTSYNNTICSPYTCTWHVDKKCYKITAASFDNFCRELLDSSEVHDATHAHGSRMLVDPAFVAGLSHVKRLD